MRIFYKISYLFAISLSGALFAQQHDAEYVGFFTPKVSISYSFDKPSKGSPYTLCTEEVAVAAELESNGKWYASLTALPFYQDSDGKKVEFDFSSRTETQICTKCCIASDAVLQRYKYLFQRITQRECTDVGAWIVDQYAECLQRKECPALYRFWSLLAENCFSSKNNSQDVVWNAARNLFEVMLIRDCPDSDIREFICKELNTAKLFEKDERSALGLDNFQGFSAIAPQNMGASLSKTSYTFADKKAEAALINRCEYLFLNALKEESPSELSDAEKIFTPFQSPSPSLAESTPVVGDSGKQEVPQQISPPTSVFHKPAKNIFARLWHSPLRRPMIAASAAGIIYYLVQKSDPKNWGMVRALKSLQTTLKSFTACGSSFFR